MELSRDVNKEESHDVNKEEELSGDVNKEEELSGDVNKEEELSRDVNKESCLLILMRNIIHVLSALIGVNCLKDFPNTCVLILVRNQLMY